MKRTLLGSFAGAGIGFLVPFATVLLVTGSLPTRDEGSGMLVLVGFFLAGAGAIAGAVIGGVAELLAYFKNREQERQSREHREPEAKV